MIRRIFTVSTGTLASRLLGFLRDAMVAALLGAGPIADALTHVGQLAMLRRMAGSPILGENYFKADIEPGRVGPEQPLPKAPFR